MTMNWLAGIGGGVIGASVVNGARWWLRHHGPSHVNIRLPLLRCRSYKRLAKMADATRAMSFPTLAQYLTTKRDTERQREIWQAQIDREALESRGVQLPDTDAARIIAARARSQLVGDRPIKLVWSPRRGWHWEGK